MAELNIIGAKEENRYFPYQQAFRVTRQSFWTAGQDSYTLPPAQNPDMFQGLTNVEPVLEGDLQRRRGYTLLSATAPSVPFNEGYAYRNEITLARYLVWTSSSGVVVMDEAGSIYSNPLFVPSLTAGTVRMVLSRNYGYFTDGAQADYFKWDGTNVTGNLTNWGISISNNPTSVEGPNAAGTVSQTLLFAGDVPWSPGTSLPSTVTLSGAPVYRSYRLNATNYGFTVSPTNEAIAGIVVNITGSQTDPSGAVAVQLLKSGTTTGNLKGVVLPSSSGTVTLGSATDSWGASFLGSDVNDPTFGVSLIAGVNTTACTFDISAVTITIYVTGGSLAVSTSGTGITLISGRVYTVVFQNSTAGTTSGLYPFSPSTGPLTNQGVDISGIPVSSDPQVDTKLILATADGGDETTLYLIVQIPNAQTTYHDSMPDSQLLVQPIYQETDSSGNLHGVAFNYPPPVSPISGATLNFPTKCQGRIFGTIGPVLYYSKNLDDVTTSTGTITGKWEEAWPATNATDISELAETVTGLQTDGQTLYIGTDTSIRQMTNLGGPVSGFVEPVVVFNETGVVNQEVWKIVFAEGQPVGSMWLTPDQRVMFSDFNTYQDIGTPIQDVLFSINKAVAQSVSHACFVSMGPSEYYMLYIPTGSSTTANTVCVYNMRAKKWCIWKPTDTITASLFNLNVTGVTQWLIATQAGPVYFWDASVKLDRNLNTAVPYAVTGTSSWLDFGDTGLTKAFNKVLLSTDDLSLTLAVQGAIRGSDFNAGGSIALPPSPVQFEIFGDLFIPLVAQPGFYKYYQMIFTSPATNSDGSNNTTQNILRAFDCEIAPSMRM